VAFSDVIGLQYRHLHEYAITTRPRKDNASGTVVGEETLNLSHHERLGGGPGSDRRSGYQMRSICLEAGN
jgi:hypothetical protein